MSSEYGSVQEVRGLDRHRTKVRGYPARDPESAPRRVGQVHAVEVTGDDARPLLRLLPSRIPGWVGFLRHGGLLTNGSPDEFEALAGRTPIFRMDPA